MTQYKEGRYTYYIVPESNVVKCVSTYAKVPYVGIAKCNSVDTFDEQIGKQIARTRCDAKINKAKIRLLKNDMDLAFNMTQYWMRFHGKLCVQMRKAEKERRELTFAVKEIKSF